MSQKLRDRLEITRQQELEMPIGEWVENLEPTTRQAMQSKPEWEQRGWRTCPMLQQLMNSVTASVGSPTPTAATAPSAAVSKSTPAPTKQAEKKSSSESVAFEGNIFGGDDGW